ncbi:MAG: hypothetical protein MR966_14375 [Lachnospiraceae bacterium]|nr:hypothetical protein [Lachnospiraceae bacterium]
MTDKRILPGGLTADAWWMPVFCWMSARWESGACSENEQQEKNKIGLERKDKMNYKQLIIDMVNQMENEIFLWKIYSYIRVAYLKEKFPEK